VPYEIVDVVKEQQAKDQANRGGRGGGMHGRGDHRGDRGGGRGMRGRGRGRGREEAVAVLERRTYTQMQRQSARASLVKIMAGSCAVVDYEARIQRSERALLRTVKLDRLL